MESLLITITSKTHSDMKWLVPVRVPFMDQIDLFEYYE